MDSDQWKLKVRILYPLPQKKYYDKSIRFNMTVGYFCQNDAFHLKMLQHISKEYFIYNYTQRNILNNILVSHICSIFASVWLTGGSI